MKKATIEMLEDVIAKLMEDNKHLHIEVESETNSAAFWKKKYTDLVERIENG